MIAHLRGKLIYKQPGQAIVEAAGVGYDVTISVPTFTALPSVGAEAALHIHTQVSEDQIALFGFLEREEKRLFERLITVSGVGPKLAIKMLSGLSPERTVQAIRGAGSRAADAHSRRGQKAGRAAGGGAQRQAGRLCRGARAGGRAGPGGGRCALGAGESGLSARRRRRRRSSRRSRRRRRWPADFDGLFRGALKVIR